MTLDRQAIAREVSGGAPVGLLSLLWFLIKDGGGPHGAFIGFIGKILGLGGPNDS